LPYSPGSRRPARAAAECRFAFRIERHRRACDFDNSARGDTGAALRRAIFQSAARLANVSAIVYKATMYVAICTIGFRFHSCMLARFFQNACGACHDSTSVEFT
jgi:hypothetical protein